MDLSDDEQVMVRDTAADVPEVAGFAVDMFIKLDGIKGENAGFDVFHKGNAAGFKFANALKYSGYKV